MFDPESPSNDDSGIFGLPYSTQDASLVVIPVPWDATSSQDTTSSEAPDAILDASKYVELYDPKHGAIYQRGIVLDFVDEEISGLLVQSKTILSKTAGDIDRINQLSEHLNTRVKQQVAQCLSKGKTVGLLGGDHSITYGSVHAHLSRYPDLGVLQIDAHSDLRCAYEGLTHSHASVMYNLVETLGVVSLTQVGVRGMSEFEHSYINQSQSINAFYDFDLKLELGKGRSWVDICDQITDLLPHTIYLSVDADGLDMSFCPNTGTPVPGGLSYGELLVLLDRIVSSDKRIVAFDLVEVGADPFDANNAAHLLYQLCAYAN